jgi:hypothetical protein
MSDRTRTAVIAVVTLVWLINFVAGLIPSVDYEPDQAINGIFMAIVGGLFALGAREARHQTPPPPPPPAEVAAPPEGGEPRG